MRSGRLGMLAIMRRDGWCYCVRNWY